MSTQSSISDNPRDLYVRELSRYEGYTRRGIKVTSINELDHTKITKGDMAVTIDGEQILAYLGNQIWIEADPGYLKVITVETPDPDNIWFRVPVYILHWQQFDIH